jgi:N-acetylglutamate synthase-like GNAT family acetyltransferase
VPPTEGTQSSEQCVRVRPLLAEDLDSADRVMRLAFGTFLGLPDPAAAFGDKEYVRTRFRAAPDCAWAAEVDGNLVGSVFAARWGSFGFFGPLSVHPSLWDRGIGGRLLRPVLEAFASWDVRQAGLFTFADSPKHLGLYQKHGFWPGSLTAVTAKETRPTESRFDALVSDERESGHGRVLNEIRRLTDQVFPGLDLGREIVAVQEQGLGDTVLVRRDGALEGMAVCHCGAGSEAGSDTCYVKFAAVRPGEGATMRFERLLDACETYAAESGSSRVVAGVNTGRLDAYRRLLARGFRAERIGVSMRLHPEGLHFDTPEHYVIDDLR